MEWHARLRRLQPATDWPKAALVSGHWSAKHTVNTQWRNDLTEVCCISKPCGNLDCSRISNLRLWSIHNVANTQPNRYVFIMAAHCKGWSKPLSVYSRCWQVVALIVKHTNYQSSAASWVHNNRELGDVSESRVWCVSVEQKTLLRKWTVTVNNYSHEILQVISC